MAELRAAGAIGRRDQEPRDSHQAEPVDRQGLRADPDPADALARSSPLWRSSRFLRVLGDIANEGSFVLGIVTE